MLPKQKHSRINKRHIGRSGERRPGTFPTRNDLEAFSALHVSSDVTGGSRHLFNNAAFDYQIAVNYTAGSTVPEPGTLGFLGGALIGMMFLARRDLHRIHPKLTDRTPCIANHERVRVSRLRGASALRLSSNGVPETGIHAS
jgi:PEP-CTERM motif